MKQSILIIDDEEVQARNLAEALSNELPDFDVVYASKEEDIQTTIVSRYFSIALIDLRMDNYMFDGCEIIEWISEINPYAKVIAVSAYTEEYILKLSSY